MTRTMLGYAWPPTPLSGNGAASQVTPLASELVMPANATGRSGVRTDATIVYTSSIDSALTDLKTRLVYDNGCAALGALPVLLLIHAYPGGVTASDAVLQELADKGFAVVMPSMRGRDSTSGAQDDGCRELQDLIDAIAACDAAHPAEIDTTKLHIQGTSGGGALALALLCKYPGRWITAVVSFGFPDYGVSAIDSLYGTYQASQSSLVSNIGARSAPPTAAQLQPYRARRTLDTIVDALAIQEVALYMFADVADPIGLTLRGVRDALRQTSRTLRSTWAYIESQVGDTVRYAHNNPTFGDPPWSAMIATLLNRRARPAPAAITNAFRYHVLGHLVLPSGLAIWTSTSGSPKTGTASATLYCLDANIDVAAQKAQIVGCRADGLATANSCNVGLYGTFNQLSVVSPDTVESLDASTQHGLSALAVWTRCFDSAFALLPVSPGNFASWTDQVGGALQMLPAGAGHSTTTTDPAVAFTGNGNQRDKVAAVLTTVTDFAIIVRAKKTASSGIPIAFDTDGSTSVWVYIDMTGSTIDASIFNSTEDTIADPFTVGTGYHTILLQRTGSTLKLRVDNRTPVAGSSSKVLTSLSNASLGNIVYAGPTDFQPFTGSVSHVAWKQSALTAQEEADVFDYLTNL